MKWDLIGGYTMGYYTVVIVTWQIGNTQYEVIVTMGYLLYSCYKLRFNRVLEIQYGVIVTMGYYTVVIVTDDGLMLL